MDARARRALRVIQRCVAEERYVVLPHFTQRMHRREFFWPDVLTIIDDPSAVRFDGRDRHGRPKWIVAGRTMDGLDMEIVSVMDRDKRGRFVVFITIY